MCSCTETDASRERLAQETDDVLPRRLEITSDIRHPPNGGIRAPREGREVVRSEVSRRASQCGRMPPSPLSARPLRGRWRRFRLAQTEAGQCQSGGASTGRWEAACLQIQAALRPKLTAPGNPRPSRLARRYSTFRYSTSSHVDTRQRLAIARTSRLFPPRRGAALGPSQLVVCGVSRLVTGRRRRCGLCRLRCQIGSPHLRRHRPLIGHMPNEWRAELVRRGQP